MACSARRLRIGRRGRPLDTTARTPLTRPSATFVQLGEGNPRAPAASSPSVANGQTRRLLPPGEGWGEGTHPVIAVALRQITW